MYCVIDFEYIIDISQWDILDIELNNDKIRCRFVLLSFIRLDYAISCLPYLSGSFITFPFFFSSICERITPRLAHANAAVVLSAVKCLMKFMELMVSDSEFVKNLSKKLAPPLVTLLSSEPEVSRSVRFIYLFK